LGVGGTGRGTPLVPAVAFGWMNAAAQGMPVDSLSPTLDKSKHPATMQGTAVRRLMPLECERLQGFPLIAERIIIDICIDQANSYAVVDLRCLRWHSSVSPADGGDLTPFASSAEVDSSIGQAVRAPLAAVHVLPRSEGEEAQIRSQGRLRSNANGASGQNWCHHRTLNVNTARSLALTLRELAHSVRSGKAASRLHMLLSTAARNGDKPAPIFGGATEAGASDATSGHHSVTFTTSELGRLTPISDSREATLCCSVMAVIAGSIPSETLPACFSLELTVVTPYTAIPWRGKTAADGPRYKALGNSWAVNCARWIGQRIEAVDAIALTKERAAA
jgi:site-specific DNA-cytosine methylase